MMMQFYYKIWFLALLLVAVESRRVIRAVPDARTTGKYIIVLSENTTHSEFEAMLREILKESPDSDVHEQVEGKFAKIIATNISEEIAHKLKHSNKVEFIEEECYATSSVSWALDRIDQESSQLDNVFSPKGTGEGVDIYILDTGINYDHNEFGGRAKYPGFDPVDKGDGENRRGRDCDGHGTHVASLAAGTDFGVAKKADVYSVRVLDCQGSAPWSFIIDGLNSAAERIGTQKRPAVISMSLGGSFSNSLNVALQNVLKKNLTVVAAAGNERNDACNTSPGGTTGVITVGGTAINDNTYYYTNGGNCVDILAPGNNVEAADYKCNSCKITFSGTSMATPIVSGAVALYLQTNPNMTPTQIRNKLIADSVKNKINYQNLRSSLRQTTANRLLQIQAGAATTSTVTATSTVTDTSTVTSTAIFTSTSLSISTTTTSVVTTSIVTLTSLVPTTITIPTTVFIATTPTPTPGVGIEDLNQLDDKILTGMASMFNDGIRIIADVVQNKSIGEIPTIAAPTDLPGSTVDTAVKSCGELTQSTSGMYWIELGGGEKKRMYCNLDINIKNHTGFMNVANINMSVPGTECPKGLLLRQDGNLRTCQRGKAQPGCSSVYFNSSGMEYTRVCGRLRGYQYSTPNAFFYFSRNQGSVTIDDHYVDGVALSYNAPNGSRQHIWTFAGALDDMPRTHAFACSCTNSQYTYPVPSFVGNDYFCETGSKGFYNFYVMYADDPLWDGDGCGNGDSCCERGEWFCKDVPKTSSDIELRLCANEVRSNEDTPLEIIELYVQ